MKNVILNTGEVVMLDYEFIFDNFSNTLNEYTRQMTSVAVSDDGIWISDVIDDSVIMSTGDIILLSDDFIKTHFTLGIISALKSNDFEYDLHIQEII